MLVKLVDQLAEDTFLIALARNFSPGGTTEELEDYRVELDGVSALDLRIDPDRSHDSKQSRHVASLQRLRLA